MCPGFEKYGHGGQMGISQGSQDVPRQERTLGITRPNRSVLTEVTHSEILNNLKQF